MGVLGDHMDDWEVVRAEAIGAAAERVSEAFAYVENQRRLRRARAAAVGSSGQAELQASLHELAKWVGMKEAYWEEWAREFRSHAGTGTPSKKPPWRRK